MPEPAPILYIDRSEVTEGKLPELREAYRELAAFVDANEPRILAYNVYFTQDGRFATVLHAHPDAASLETHFRVAGPAFARFAGLLRLLSIDVYGDPGDAVMAQVRQKAELLGGATVRLHAHHAGFERNGAPG